MFHLKRVQAEGLCVFCDKSKEVVAVAMDGEGPGEILLCWADVKKMAHMKMRVGGKVTPKPVPAVPSVNNVVAAAK